MQCTIHYVLWHVICSETARTVHRVTSEKRKKKRHRHWQIRVGAIRYTVWQYQQHNNNNTRDQNIPATFTHIYSHALICSISCFYFPRARSLLFSFLFLSLCVRSVVVRGMCVCVCSTCEPIFRSGVYFVWKVCYRVESCTHTQTHLWFSVRSSFAK